MKLTTDTVARLKLPAGKSDKIFWDDALPAFGLRMQGARKSWVVQYRAGGMAQRRLSFATAEQLSLADARREAGRLLAEVRLGHDPAGDKRKRVEAVRAQENAPKAVTLGEAVALYLPKAKA
ncbi:MAG: DUF4102 domain-containing protein, partial [Hyphomicrobiales bacterium]|nr:DUF4102 domain-containing protein [Hyphomicrobiales bacterium]